MIVKAKNIFFVGVGGIGMSALARFFNSKNYNVAGYDRVNTGLTRQLVQEGIKLITTDELSAIPNEFRNPENTLVIYTPAIHAEHHLLHYFKTNGFECMKRAAMLGKLSKAIPTVAIAGTHGKTTISTMIAHVLQHAGMPINAFLGGISRNFNSNLLIDEKAVLNIVEADEYDRSFLQLQPETAVISSLSIDHLESYRNAKELYDAYNKFSEQILKGGSLFVHQSVLEHLSPQEHYQLKTYGGSGADLSISNIHLKDEAFYFDIDYEGIKTEGVRSGIPGLHNIENTAVVFGLAISQGLKPTAIKAALLDFKGIERRFDLIIKKDDFIYVDDYAHHPEAIEALIKSVRKMYPHHKITAVFQPHLYSRTKDFAEDFARSLSAVDQLALMELYPAREKPIEGVNSRWLAGKIKNKSIAHVDHDSLMAYLKNEEIEVLLTIGAGDIREMVPKIKEYYE